MKTKKHRLRRARSSRAFTPLEKTSDFNAGCKSVVESGGIKLPSSFVGERNSLTGFTLAEILTVMVIIAILVGILMPALNQVKKLAKETKQKAQIVSIEIAVNLYKDDFGYPPSHGSANAACNYGGTPGYPYCGAQTLVEAMFGYDLLGFHPDSKYDPCDPCYAPSTSNARKDPYLDRTNISLFTPFQIFGKDTCPALEPHRYVICDVFTAVSRNIVLPNGSTKTCKIGTPVLYFRANPSAVNTEFIPHATLDANNVYDYTDNRFLMREGKISDNTIEHPLCPFNSKLTYANNGTVFYDYIRDPMVPLPLRRAFRPDSFILISAGSDGLYGTRDDICNFEPNLPG